MNSLHFNLRLIKQIKFISKLIITTRYFLNFPVKYQEFSCHAYDCSRYLTFPLLSRCIIIIFFWYVTSLSLAKVGFAWEGTSTPVFIRYSECGKVFCGLTIERLILKVADGDWIISGFSCSKIRIFVGTCYHF